MIEAISGIFIWTLDRFSSLEMNSQTGILYTEPKICRKTRGVAECHEILPTLTFFFKKKTSAGPLSGIFFYNLSFLLSSPGAFEQASGVSAPLATTGKATFFINSLVPGLGVVKGCSKFKLILNWQGVTGHRYQYQLAQSILQKHELAFVPVRRTK